MSRRSQRSQRHRDAETSIHSTAPIVRSTTAKDPVHTPDNLTTQATDDSVRRTLKRGTPYCNDTDVIVNQLALLATTVTRSSSRDIACNKRSLSAQRVDTANIQLRQERDQEETEEEQNEEDESFHYLRSLITVSCLPQHTSGNASLTTDPDPNGNPLPRRKRASSRLSLRLGELPALPFTPKISRKPCPRYTTLPPVYTAKPTTIRPEVRF